MAKVGIVLLADTDTAGDMGRMANALTSAKEFKDGNDEVGVIFDGAGTKWVAELARPDHKYHQLFAGVQNEIRGACAFCASAYGVKEKIEQSQVPLLDEYADHPSLKKLVDDGYQVITF